MKATDLYLAMQELDDILVEKYAKVRKKQTISIRTLVAACLAAVLLVGSGIVAVDAVTYAQAKDFFAKNGLSAQGLSREDVRAIYRDIATNSFVYEKTNEVISHSINQAVPGYEIAIDIEEPEKLRMLWENWRNGALAKIVIDWEVRESSGDIYQDGVWYEEDPITVFNEEMGRLEIRETVVRKHQNDVLCWESIVPIMARLIRPIGDCTVIVGENEHIFGPADMPREGMHQRIVYLDKNGQILWEDFFTEENWCTAAENDRAYDNGDGTFTVITRGARRENSNVIRSVVVWRYDLKGQLLSHKVNDIGSWSLSEVFASEDYYILSLSNEAAESKTVIMDADGTMYTGAEYHIADHLQRIQDIVEMGSYRYISAYTMRADGTLDELGRVNAALTKEKKTLWEQADSISENELIERICSHYTAVLLCCDIETGQVQTLYSVPGVIADKLEVSESGKLVWSLQSLTEAEMVATPNDHTDCIIRGTSVICRYIFDTEGNLIEKENTGEFVTHRW